MPGVEVSVLGSSHGTKTDSTGAFFLPVKPGRYLVVLKRDGFARQTIGVTVPRDEGRKIAAWLVPTDKRPDPVAAAMLFELPLRMMRATSVSAKYYTREDLEQLGVAELRQVAVASSMGRLESGCPVIIDGDPRRTLPLWLLSTAEVEFVEVYAPRNRMPGVGAANLARFGAEMRQAAASGCTATVYAWLRH